MLQKKYRLKKYSAFIATYKQNNTISDKNICIYLGKEKSSPDITTKFAFVVSKKVHKRAVVRNRIKRLMRESVRNLIKQPEFTFFNKYMSVIFIGKSFSINATYTDINSSILKMLSDKGV